MMDDCWSLPKQDGSQEQHVSSEDGGKSYGLKMFLSQGKRPVARKTLGAISPVAARLSAFPNGSTIW
jgi:hypothetical protein